MIFLCDARAANLLRRFPSNRLDPYMFFCVFFGVSCGGVREGFLCCVLSPSLYLEWDLRLSFWALSFVQSLFPALF